MTFLAAGRIAGEAIGLARADVDSGEAVSPSMQADKLGTEHIGAQRAHHRRKNNPIAIIALRAIMLKRSGAPIAVMCLVLYNKISKQIRGLINNSSNNSNSGCPKLSSFGGVAAARRSRHQ